MKNVILESLRISSYFRLDTLTSARVTIPTNSMHVCMRYSKAHMHLLSQAGNGLVC